MGYIWVQEIEDNLSDEELDFLYQASFHVGKIIYKKNASNKKRRTGGRALQKAINDQFQTEKS
ncbi:hypothetical protein PO124_25495 [Bacillus licheniformis]|nr:hypothetical protein [Bacillus licheniformis]